MAILKVPLNNDFNEFRQTQTLDGVQYSFRFRYNSRNDTWYLTIFSDSNIQLVGPKPCLSNIIHMAGRMNQKAFLLGDIIFLDVSGNEVDCTQENFGSSVTLFYQNVLPDEVTNG